MSSTPIVFIRLARDKSPLTTKLTVCVEKTLAATTLDGVFDEYCCPSDSYDSGETCHAALVEVGTVP